jgi:hypothetical protein
MSKTGYTLNTFANGFGLWRCEITFDYPGLGNTQEAEVVKYRALDSAKVAIRKEIVARESRPVRRLSYEIVANKLDSLNRLHSLTVGEKNG